MGQRQRTTCTLPQMGENSMGFMDRWKLGALALNLMQRAADLARTVDFDAVLTAAAKIVELERSLSGPGNGAEKLARLLQWFTSAFPQHAYSVGILRDFAGALVGLLNVVKVFRK